MIAWSPHIFETVMLICFGCSWPFAIAKTIRTKAVEGKSIIFIMLIFIGYVAGICFKLMGHFDHVIWLYITNGSLVFTEILLYFKYNRRKNHSPIRAITRVDKKPGRFMVQASKDSAVAGYCEPLAITPLA